jgi:hypothetical protein
MEKRRNRKGKKKRQRKNKENAKKRDIIYLIRYKIKTIIGIRLDLINYVNIDV